jgi:hypothetical protein
MAQDLTGDADEESAPTVADRLAAVRVRLAAVRPFIDFASKVTELEDEEKALLEEERADRPLPRRLQSAMDTLRDRGIKASKARAAADEARASWEAAEAHAAQSEKEESTSREALAKVEKEVAGAVRASAPLAMDVDAVKNALDSVVAACSAVLMPSDAVSAAALVDQLRAALNAKAAAVGGGMGAVPNDARVGSSVHAGGSGVASAPADGSGQPGADGADAHMRSAAKRPPAAARASGRRGTSPAMASCEGSDEDSGRSRSRERTERERKEVERLAQERTSRDVVEGRQRTIGDALARGTA